MTGPSLACPNTGLILAASDHRWRLDGGAAERATAAGEVRAASARHSRGNVAVLAAFVDPTSDLMSRNYKQASLARDCCCLRAEEHWVESASGPLVAA